MTAVQPPSPDERRTDDSNGGYVTGIADGNLATPVKLGEYLAGIGVVFRLPRRNKKQEAREAAADTERKRFKLRLPVRPILLALAPVAVAVLGYYAWDNWLSTVPLPSQVSGTWSTTDGKYAGRNFWINQSEVAFQNGKTAADFAVHPIKRIKSRQAGDSLFLSIDYTQDEKPVTLSLIYRDQPVPEIRLANQPRVRWAKVSTAPGAQ